MRLERAGYSVCVLVCLCKTEYQSIYSTAHHCFAVCVFNNSFIRAGFVACVTPLSPFVSALVGQRERQLFWDRVGVAGGPSVSELCLHGNPAVLVPGCYSTEFRLFLGSITVAAAMDEAVTIATRSHPS